MSPELTISQSSTSSMVLAPQNFLDGDPSRRTIHQARINYVNGSVTDAVTFGTKQPTCSVPLSVTAPDLKDYKGEIYIDKFPYHPDAQQIGNPGEPIYIQAP